jgi:hypothetical protein
VDRADHCGTEDRDLLYGQPPPGGQPDLTGGQRRCGRPGCGPLRLLWCHRFGRGCGVRGGHNPDHATTPAVTRRSPASEDHAGLTVMDEVAVEFVDGFGKGDPNRR